MKKKAVYFFCAVAFATHLFGVTNSVTCQTRVHIYIRGFIPKDHPGNPGYVRPVPSNPSVFVIPSPTITFVPPFFRCNPTVSEDNSCFTTDNRAFSNSVDAPFRAGTEFVLVISGNTVTVEKADGREIQRTGPTHKVNCQTGMDLVPSQSAATSNMHMGTPAFADGIIQVVVDGRANNPLITPSPDIQYGGTFSFDTKKNTLRFQGSSKVFPAYEAYAQLNAGAIVALFQNSPDPNTTVCDLIDLGSGVKQKAIDVTVTLPDNLDGKWETTDGDKRFLLQITGTSVQWTERGTPNTTPGAVFARAATVTMSVGKFRIERQNDNGALTFLGFQPQSLRDAIMARNPQPSFIVFTHSGNTLTAEWNGLVVTKNPDGTLKDVIQPGVRPPKPFTFSRIP